MDTEKKNSDFEKPTVDEDYLMHIISGEQVPAALGSPPQAAAAKEGRPRDKPRNASPKNAGYEETFLANRFPSGRNGKVVYIRPEYHERLLRIVQLTREEKTTLYSYIDNILEDHFREYGEDITTYFNERFKPIL